MTKPMASSPASNSTSAPSLSEMLWKPGDVEAVGVPMTLNVIAASVTSTWTGKCASDSHTNEFGPMRDDVTRAGATEEPTRRQSRTSLWRALPDNIHAVHEKERHNTTMTNVYKPIMQVIATGVLPHFGCVPARIVSSTCR